MMSEQDPQMFVAGGRRRGRPRVAEPGSTLSIWIPATEHDRYSRLAAERGESISKTVGTILKAKEPRIT